MNQNKTNLISDEQISSLRDLIEKYRPRFGTFEKETLFPEVLGRLKHTLDLCNEMRAMCSDQKFVHSLELVFLKLVQDGHTHYAPTDSNAAKSYFAAIIVQLDRDFITPLKALIADFKKNKDDYAVEEIASLLNRSSNLFQIFVGLRERLFHYSAGTFMSARDHKTGKIVVDVPAELDIMVMPFKTRVEEIANVADRTIESISRWGENLRQNKTQFIDLVIKTTESNTAKTNLAAAQRNFWIQILIAFVALILIALGYFGNLLLENRSLSRSLETKENELQQCRGVIAVKTTENQSLLERPCSSKRD